MIDTFSGIGGFSLAAAWTRRIQTVQFIEDCGELIFMAFAVYMTAYEVEYVWREWRFSEEA